MKIETLKDRIENAKAKIEKKQATIEKKTALIAKKENKRSKMTDELDIREIEWDIKYLREDIDRLTKEIEETKKSLAKYEAQLVGELERDSILLKDVPESMKQMQTELVARWDEWDFERRENIRRDHAEMPYKEFQKKYKYSDWEFMYKTNDQIHNANVQDAKSLIINLYYRIKDITGEVTDWSGIKCVMGAYGAVLNGYVVGKEGRAEVDTILAGGYNIQRLHVRTLVKSVG